ncbi:odorant receptor 131-2-like [Dendropsophus ebraccatus]|uniref:odorant receptor 131-2-like n=1 Tax=Dendropsophus ebraccatus TaxID=150705 RepID=UPI003831F642
MTNITDPQPNVTTVVSGSNSEFIKQTEEESLTRDLLLYSFKPWIMTNITDLQQNITQVVNKSNQDLMRQTLSAITICSFVVFFYIMAVMLTIYFTNPSAREEARYVLFAHMLITDVVYLFFSLFLFLVSFYPVTFPVPFCIVIMTITSTSLKVTPYNLAVMSLERYIAICFPLRHGELCTFKRTTFAIGVTWAIGFIPIVADLIVLSLSVDRSFFLLYIKCTRSALRFTEVQNTIRDFVYMSTFSLVGLIIIFTYIKITMVAMKVGSGLASAAKAGKTVMLHAFQLLLCMMAFGYTLLDVLLKDYVVMSLIINFCLFMCLPRFLSPFIYGLKDEFFRRHMKKYLLCKVKTVF